MANELSTVFKYNDADNAKILGTKTLLIETNALFNSLGKDANFGKTLNENFGLAGKGADDFKKKTEDLSKPTFGGEYVEETKKINDAWEKGAISAEKYQSAADKALKSTKGLADAGANSLREMQKFYEESAGITPKTKSFGLPNNALLNEAEKSRLIVQNLNGLRLDGKNLDGLTQAGVRLHDELGRVKNDIAGINSTLSKTTNKNLIKILNEDLSVAEDKLSRLNKNVQRYQEKASPTDGLTETTITGRRGKITEGQRALLEVLDDFAPAGLNRPFNAIAKEILVAVNAKTALTAATTASTAATTASTAATVASTAAQTAEGTAVAATTVAVEAETAAFAGLSLASLGIFAGVAAAGFLVVNASKKIREEAEHNLKVQNDITAELNKQRLAAKELERSFAEQQANAIRGENFSRSLSGATIEQLTRREKSLEQSITQTKLLRIAISNNRDSSPDKFKKLDNDDANDYRELSEIKQQLRNSPFDKAKASEDAFSKQGENFRKSEENRLASERKYADKVAEYNKKRADDLEKANDKIKEISKNANSAFDGLYQKLNKDNPVAMAFIEGRRELEALKESLRGLSPELQNQAFAIQKELTDKAVFGARLDQDFAAFDLKERANDLRSFRTPKIDDTDKFFKDFIEAGLKQIGASNGGGTRYNLTGAGNSTFGFSQSNENPFIRYNSNIYTDKNGKQFTTGFTQTDLRDELLTVFERTGGFQESSGGKGFGNNIGGFFRREKTFADLTEKEKNDFINKDNLSLQDKLSRSFDLASNRSILNDDQQSAVDRRVLALSSSYRPDQLNDKQRDIVATAAEKEAARKNAREEKVLNYQKNISEEMTKLREIAQKGGLNAVKVVIQNESNGTASADYLPDNPAGGATVEKPEYQFSGFGIAGGSNR